MITFTKAAAWQMRERFQTRMGGMACPVNFGTFHAVFYHILQLSAPSDSNTVLSEKDKIEYLQRVLLTLPVQSDSQRDFPADDEWKKGLLGEIGYIKNAGCMPPNFHSMYLEDAVFKQVFLAFQRLLYMENKMDFDDFAAACKHLFHKKPQILKAWQEKYQYVLVDEFQDINPAQYEVVKLLAGTGQNLFVVGDDDQSIYGFRASDPGMMKQFLQDFPEAKQILLSVNYRCAPGIVKTAGRLIDRNRQRFPKIITAGKQEAVMEADQEKEQGKQVWECLSSDQSVMMAHFVNRREQAENIAEKILRLQKKENQIPTTAAIFRTNTDALLLAEELSRVGVPFYLPEKVKSPYSHFVCQDLLAYLRFVFEGQKREDFYRIMNKPGRYLSRQAVSKKNVDWEELLFFYQEKSWMLPGIRRMQTDVTRMAGMDLYAAVYYVRKGMGYDRWLHQTLQKDALTNALEMADFFRESVRPYAAIEQLQQHIRNYEKELESSSKKMQTERNENVSLLTMHGAKGLEFDHVFLPDCNEGIVPHKKSMKTKEIEEERRMFYVGMTRAKEKLYLSWIAGTQENPGFPSRFLADLGYRQPWIKKQE